MAYQVGHKVIGTIIDQKGRCVAGHKVGDKFEVSHLNTGGLCGSFYNTIFPWLLVLQYGGRFPEQWNEPPDGIVVDCVDRRNAVTIELRRVGPYAPPPPKGEVSP